MNNTQPKITVVETPERVWISGADIPEGGKNYRLVYPRYGGGYGMPIVVIYLPPAKQPTDITDHAAE